MPTVRPGPEGRDRRPILSGSTAADFDTDGVKEVEPHSLSLVSAAGHGASVRMNLVGRAHELVSGIHQGATAAIALAVLVGGSGAIFGCLALAEPARNSPLGRNGADLPAGRRIGGGVCRAGVSGKSWRLVDQRGPGGLGLVHRAPLGLGDRTGHRCYRRRRTGGHYRPRSRDRCGAVPTSPLADPRADSHRDGRCGCAGLDRDEIRCRAVTSPIASQVLLETDHSFPSGHATGAMALFMTAALLLGYAWSPARRALLLVTAAVVAMVVSVTRLYLGEHWLSDVIGGMLLGGLAAVIGGAIYTSWMARSHDRRTRVLDPSSTARDRNNPTTMGQPA